MRRFLITGLLVCSVLLCFGQELARRASFEATIRPPDGKMPGVVIERIEPNAPLKKVGLQQGDRLLQINGSLVLSPDKWSDQRYALRGNRPTELLVKRGLKNIRVAVSLNELPHETHPGITTRYTSLISDYGLRQRVIITRPEKVEGPQPALFLLQGLSCSSIEQTSSRSSNWVRMINELVGKSGMVVLRIEKPGVGDSEGACSETDFLTELNGYRIAAQHLKTLPYVDSSRIVVYGSSMGSALAPLIANEFNFTGVISDGTFFKSWFEHMLEIERRIRQMSGDSESEITREMNQAYIPLYYGMLIQKKSYQELIDEYPAIAKYNYHSPAHMYGRPMTYYQQLQDFDLASAWEQVTVPVRILRGTNDWIMSAFDNQKIIDVLEPNGHQDHLLYEYEGLDHWNTIHCSATNSFKGESGVWEDDISGIIIRWAQELVGEEESR